jgi:2-oxoisovalerate dehydrogenase E1 component
MNDPVLFFEHKGLYRQGYSATPEPDENYILPFGKAKIVRLGEEITIITWGAMVQKSIEAVKSSGLNNGEVEIIDLRTLNPIDMEAIQKSVQKTGKVLIVHEDTMTGGPGAEIAARIVNELFEYLDGPIARVAAKDCHIPYSWVLEEQILPQTADIESALTDLLEY